MVQWQVASFDGCHLTIEFIINKSKVLNILCVSKLPSSLLACFVQVNKLFINSIGRIHDQCQPFFAQHSTSHTLDSFSLFLSPYLSLTPWFEIHLFISVITLLSVHLLNHWIHTFQQTLFSFEGLPYNIFHVQEVLTHHLRIIIRTGVLQKQKNQTKALSLSWQDSTNVKWVGTFYNQNYNRGLYYKTFYSCNLLIFVVS